MRIFGRTMTFAVALFVLSIFAAGNSLAADAVPTATLNLSASATTYGGSATLSWSSTNATYCTASDAWSGKLATSGTQSTGPLTKNSTYVMTCTGPGGTSAVVKRGINVIPTVTLTANPTSVASGTASTLTWTSTNATSCTASGGWSGTLATSGSQSTGALTQSKSYTISCTGIAGTGTPATTTVTVSGAAGVPTATLNLSASATTYGGSATLSWSSTNATYCTASNAWSGKLATSGTQSTGPLTKNSTYVMTCTGPGGTSAVVKRGINVIPTVTLTANPTSVASGTASTLTWTSTNATSCTASGGWSGTLATSGSQSTGALTQSKSYTISCTGIAGTGAPATTTVTVSGAAGVPTATLNLSASAVPYGGTATLTWSSTNATYCTASDAWGGTLATSGTRSTGLLTRNSTYVMTCTGPGGTSAVVKRGINVIPTVTLTASPTSVASGTASTLTWTSTNATSCTASGGWSGTLAANGNQSTGALTQNKSYTISCTGIAGTGAPATATVTIASGTPTMSVSPKSAAITLTRTQQFVATVPGGGSVTWKVDGTTNGNSTVGTISASGLYTAGTAVGSHTVTAISAADSTKSATAVAAVTDLAGVYTYHNDTARDGANLHEYALTPSNVNTNSFGKLASCAVDGAIYGQPLWAANLTVSGAVHNVVFVATQHDSIYAFDADASPCVKLWSASLIDAAHGAASGETTVPYTLVGYAQGAIQPEIGVTGTPVIDPTTGILYVVSHSTNSAQTAYYQRLHAIDVSTGLEKHGSPATITGTFPRSNGTTVTFDPRQELQRTALAVANHIVFIAWASQEDKAPWYGWIMGYQYNGTSLVQSSVLNVAPNTQGGGIWMSGGAPAIDASNNLYYLTGNGGFDASNGAAPQNDYGDSLLQLTTALHVSQYFTPTDQLADNQNDKDFGSGGSAILADLPAGNTVTHALIAGGKDGSLYVLNRDLLGGYGDQVAVQQIALGHPIFATGAFWSNHLYLAGINGPLTSYQLNTSTAQFTLGTSSTHVFGFAGVTPSVSAASSQSGIVWALDTGSYCTTQAKSCGPVVLHAYDATNMGTELWNSSLNAADAAGYAVKFTVPTVANGKVYVGTRGNNIGGVYGSTSVAGELDIYGLKP